MIQNVCNRSKVLNLSVLGVPKAPLTGVVLLLDFLQDTSAYTQR